MKQINLYATEVQYFDHMIPIWERLPDQHKGSFYVSMQVKVHRPHKDTIVGIPPKSTVLVASYGNFKDVDGDILFMEHGIGHTYGRKGIHHSYAGGEGKERVNLFLNQHHLTDKLNRQAYPNAQHAIIGTPKMDRWGVMGYRPKDIPIVCFSFHWDCMISPESRTSFDYYVDEMRKLSKINKPYKIVLHGHPKKSGMWQKKIARDLRGTRYEFIDNFEQVMEQADVYVNDNSSTMYEFASLDKPVIVLNSPHYRRNVDNGIRFWDYIAGIQVNDPKELHEKILHTLEYPNEYRLARQMVIDDLYPYRPNASQRAVEVIVKYLNGHIYDLQV